MVDKNSNGKGLIAKIIGILVVVFSILGTVAAWAINQGKDSERINVIETRVEKIDTRSTDNREVIIRLEGKIDNINTKQDMILDKLPK